MPLFFSELRPAKKAFKYTEFLWQQANLRRIYLNAGKEFKADKHTQHRKDAY